MTAKIIHIPSANIVAVVINGEHKFLCYTIGEARAICDLIDPTMPIEYLQMESNQ